MKRLSPHSLLLLTNASETMHVMDAKHIVITYDEQKCFGSILIAERKAASIAQIITILATLPGGINQRTKGRSNGID